MSPAPQSTEFSLRALAREVWAELEGADYHDFAKELQRRIRAKDRDAALAQALTEWARRFAADQRPTSAAIARLIQPDATGALRAIAKTVLRDLWREAKRLHEAAEMEGEQAA